MTKMVRRSGISGSGLGASLRPTVKVLPEHARAHNRSLVLQHLFSQGPTSRASLSRATGLTRVTISDLVGALIEEGLVVDLGVHPEGRVGKPASLVAMRTEEFQIVTLDLSREATMRGAIMTLTGDVVSHHTVEIDNREGQEMIDLMVRFCRLLLSRTTKPVIGIGIGSPGVIDLNGHVINAPNRGWTDVPLAQLLTDELGIPVHVANDADSAALGEFTYGDASGEGLLALTVGEGVGAGIILDGAPVRGVRSSAGEVGHVQIVDSDDALACACGGVGHLETVLREPALRKATQDLAPEDSEAHLASVGRLLGRTLAPVVSTLNLVEIVLCGPSDLLDGPLRESALEAIRARIMPSIGDGLSIRMAALGEDVVLSGAAVLVLSGQLGVS